MAALSDEPAYVDLTEGLTAPYHLDRASLHPPRALDVHPGQTVLDMCAAPGGKTLVLALSLQGRGHLVANDLSPDRRRRLREVLESRLPSTLRATIRITGGDASHRGMREPAFYDRILLDAPCSSERHLLQAPDHLARWTPGRSRNLARRQYALLTSAFDALKPGGRLVYSTCALAPGENDGVVGRLLKRRDGVGIRNTDDEIGEVTDHGRIILPDRCDGAGPIYWSVIVRE